MNEKMLNSRFELQTQFEQTEMSGAQLSMIIHPSQQYAQKCHAVLWTTSPSHEKYSQFIIPADQYHLINQTFSQ